jgi:hypothetical protein
MDGDLDSLEQLREKVKGTNINEQTLLATDYLNHLNEPIMLLEMVADAPELLDELAEWHPKSYVEHFADSSFADKELAIRAYAVAPEKFREPFDRTIDSASRCICTAVKALTQLSEQSRTEDMRTIATEVTTILGELVDRASSIIHGKVTTLGQTQIDQIMSG